MNTTRSSIPVAEVPAYTELQREIHDALRAQHPEWILPNGDCPTCDSYDARFAELLIALLATERALAHHREPSRSPAGHLDDPGSFSMPAGYTEPRNIVFAEVASAIR
jgi:hypothetical protein